MNNNIEEAGYRIKLDFFEGPFDLLLYLIQNAKININDISISEITGQYINYIKNQKNINLNEISSFIYTATILLLMKSKSLIPQEIDIDNEEHCDERKELIDNLLEYQKYRQAAEVLKKNLEEHKLLFRNEPQLLFDFQDNENWVELSLMDLVIAFSRVAKEIDRSIFKAIEGENITIDEKIDEIMTILASNKVIMLDELFPENCSKYVLIISFLALLELVKMKKVYILQHKLFGNIKIIRREQS